MFFLQHNMRRSKIKENKIQQNETFSRLILRKAFDSTFCSFPF